MSILDDRDVTADERVAVADEPRPGVWIEPNPPRVEQHGDFTVTHTTTRMLADGRLLTQAETDHLIIWELHETAAPIDRPALVAAIGSASPIHLYDAELEDATRQRGGIHSDQLVRLLAYRAWGDRDRVWFKNESDEHAAMRILSVLQRTAQMHSVSLDRVINDAVQIADDRGRRLIYLAHDIQRERDLYRGRR